MLLNEDYVTPVELTGYVRAALADQPRNRVILDQWLPNVEQEDLIYRFAQGGTALQKIAHFTVYDAESELGSRPGVTRVTGELPPLSRKVRLDAYTYARNRANPDVIRTNVENDAVQLMQAISDRLELARGQALNLGKLVISENGVVATVDFGRSAGHDVTAGVLWSSTSTADPITDMLAWQDTYVTDTGSLPGALLMTRSVLTYLLTNAKIIGNVHPAASTTASRVSRADLNALLDDFELPPIQIVDKKVNVDGTVTPIIPVNRMVFAPAPGSPDDNQLGATLYGPTVDADELNITGEEAPGIVAAVYKDNDPVALWTKAAAIALPVLANPDLTFAATVA